MKLKTVSLILFGLILISCKSEYEERLEQAKELKDKMQLVQTSNSLATTDYVESELESIEEEIYFLAKVSGNEELFLREVFKR